MSRTSEVVALVVAITVLIGIVILAARHWLRQDDEWTLPEWQGQIPGPGLVYTDEWDDPAPVDGWGCYPSCEPGCTRHVPSRDEWDQLDPDTQAETLIAEWHAEASEHTADTDSISLLDDIQLLAWDAGRQVDKIRKLRGRWRVEMAGVLAEYQAQLEQRRAA